MSSSTKDLKIHGVTEALGTRPNAALDLKVPLMKSITVHVVNQDL